MPLESAVTGSNARALAVGVGVAAAAGLAMSMSKRLAAVDRPPADSEWRQVGRLAELYCYPLKSGKPLAVNKLETTAAGLRQGTLRDRVFVAVDRTGRFVSGRTHPRLLMVAITLDTADAVKMVFRSPVEGAAPLTVDTAALQTAPRTKVRVWSSTISAVDCGDEAAAWIRKAVVEPEVHGEATAAADLRLMYYPDEQTDRKGPSGTPGIYSDQSSYHILTKSSLAELNNKLADPVSALNFRPNFVVEGPAAYDEDNWAWIRIGDKAIFKTVMPCGRCLLTTVDPETGIKSADSEPFKTLQSIRKPNEQQKKAMGSDSPMMGLRLALSQIGEVSVGDIVYVAP